MGFKFGTNKEEIWRNQTMCGFQKPRSSSDKDNYPVPPMEPILQMVSGSELFSLLDGFSGYNQVLVAEEDRIKTTFKTKWGTFSYRRIKSIEHIPLPHNKKGMQSFMGTINFVRRFVPDFAQIVKPLQQMVKQSVQFKWTDVEKIHLVK